MKEVSEEEIREIFGKCRELTECLAKGCWMLIMSGYFWDVQISFRAAQPSLQSSVFALFCFFPKVEKSEKFDWSGAQNKS